MCRAKNGFCTSPAPKNKHWNRFLDQDFLINLMKVMTKTGIWCPAYSDKNE